MSFDIHILPTLIDYSSVIVGALTGALVACERRLDIIGAIVSGLLTAYGGGVIRDLLLQNQGVYFMQHPNLVLFCIVLCIFVFYFHSVIKNFDATIFFADALSVALYSLAGASKAWACGASPVLCILMGAITGVAGGALRDIASGEVPGILRVSNYYAVAAVGGAALYVVERCFDASLIVSSVSCVFAVVMLRYWSVCFDWRTAEAQDTPPELLRHPLRTLKKIFLRGGRIQARMRFTGIFGQRSRYSGNIGDNNSYSQQTQRWYHLKKRKNK